MPRFSTKRTVLLFCVLPLIAIGAYALKLRLTYNWGPPEILAQAFASPVMERRGLIEVLNVQYLIGTDKAALRSALLRHGFADAPQARARPA